MRKCPRCGLKLFYEPNIFCPDCKEKVSKELEKVEKPTLTAKEIGDKIGYCARHLTRLAPEGLLEKYGIPEPIKREGKYLWLKRKFRTFSMVK